MGKNMRTRIFWPVLAVILFLTAAVWLAFAVTSDWYEENTAKKRTEKIIERFDEVRAEPSEELEILKTENEARQYSAELLEYAKKQAASGKMKGKLLIFNSAKKRVYPTDSDNKAEDRLLRGCIAMIEENADSLEADEIRDINGISWHLRMLALDTEYNIEAKYFVAASRLPNVSSLWEYMSMLMVGITVASIALGALLVWLAAGSITRPLGDFCRQVRLSGAECRQIEERYSLSELESLRNAYNGMNRSVCESRENQERFFQNVSHDLRTPLAAIIGYAQGIQQGVMKDPKEAAGIILTESIRMRNMVDSILTLTKIDNKELMLKPIELDMEEFLSERIDALRGMAGDCEIELDIRSEELFIRTDPELLSRILQNVISNCIRYAEHRIMVRLAVEDDRGLIYIEDDGKGFDKEELPHVFERFYKGEYGDYGIGLSIVRAGMEYLGGSVELGNIEAPGHGAFYRLYLPFYKK